MERQDLVDMKPLVDPFWDVTFTGITQYAIENPLVFYGDNLFFNSDQLKQGD